MSVGARILEQIRHAAKMEGSTPAQKSPSAVTVQEGSVTVEARVHASDTLGVSLHALTVRSDRDDTSLATAAQTISAEITYLWEPLALIERDLARDRVQMRSAPPRIEGKAVEFYELELTRPDGSLCAHLTRHHHPGDLQTRREHRTFTLTHDILKRLVNDLSDILQTPEPT